MELNLTYDQWVGDPDAADAHPLTGKSIIWDDPDLGRCGFYADKDEYRKAVEYGCLAFTPLEVSRLCEAEAAGVLDDELVHHIIRLKRKFPHARVERVIPDDAKPCKRREIPKSSVRTFGQVSLECEAILSRTVYSMPPEELKQVYEMVLRYHPEVVAQIEKAEQALDESCEGFTRGDGSMAQIRRCLVTYEQALEQISLVARDPYVLSRMDE